MIPDHSQQWRRDVAWKEKLARSVASFRKRHVEGTNGSRIRKKTAKAHTEQREHGCPASATVGVRNVENPGDPKRALERQDGEPSFEIPPFFSF